MAFKQKTEWEFRTTGSNDNHTPYDKPVEERSGQSCFCCKEEKELKQDPKSSQLWCIDCLNNIHIITSEEVSNYKPRYKWQWPRSIREELPIKF
jgi:hypothetical protein